MAKPDQLRKNRKRRRDAKCANDDPVKLQTKKSRSMLAAAFFVLACVLLLVFGCGSRDHTIKWSGETMGTYYRVTLVSEKSPGESQNATLRNAVDAELTHLNQVFSTYVATSEINQWNNLPAGECLVLSESLSDVVELALDVAHQSEGYFNPFVGGLVEAWGFGSQQLEIDATPEDVQRLRQSATISAVSFDRSTATLCKPNEFADVRMDLSAVAKGYAVDRLSALLVEYGFDDMLVDIGGELYARGMNPNGEPWQLAIERPVQALQQIQQVIAVSDHGVATSGDYRNFYVREGVRYSHMIDPHTGFPVTHDLASVTVVSPSAGHADAWATALLAAGLTRAEQWANRYALAVYAIRRDNTVQEGFSVWYSDLFAHFLVKDD